MAKLNEVADPDVQRPQRCYCILVLEARPESTLPMKRLLEIDGHEVHTAGDGREGVELAKSLMPDIVMSCIELPGLDGLEVAGAICKSLPRKPFLIAHTGYGKREIGAEAKAAGFDLLLLKPFSRDDFARALAFMEGRLECRDLEL
jgi:CheY-like chemotaxis protein